MKVKDIRAEIKKLKASKERGRLTDAGQKRLDRLEDVLIQAGIFDSYKTFHQILKPMLNESKYSSFLSSVKDEVEDAIMNGDIEDDSDDVYDYLKTIYRADTPAKIYDRMTKDILKWFKKR